MAETNNYLPTYHQDNENSTDSHEEEISDTNMEADPYSKNSDHDSESLASTLTIPQMEHTKSLGRQKNSMTNDFEDELDLIDACTCIDCWTVYPEYERSPSPSSFRNIEEISDNAYNNVFEWLSKNVEQQNQESDRNFAILSTGKRKSENTNSNKTGSNYNNNQEESDERSAKFQCRNDRSRCDYSFQYQII